MAEMTSANEIKRQADRIMEQLENFYNASELTASTLQNVKMTILSEDSNLARTLDKTSEALETIEQKLNSNFTKLADIMYKFSSETITNEETSDTVTSKINSSLNEVLNELASMDI